MAAKMEGAGPGDLDPVDEADGEDDTGDGSPSGGAPEAPTDIED